LTSYRGSRHKVSGPDGEAPTNKVIVLGAGMVSAPLVEYLHRGNDLNITVGELKVFSGVRWNPYNIWAGSHVTIRHTKRVNSW
jgi:hypothetical protein